MSHRLSSPLTELKPHYVAVVVGSGYGGGIAASRIARSGQSVCLLERGKEHRPGEYPDTLRESSRQMQVDTPEGQVGDRTGLFDMRVNRDINVLVGCGLGGTSLINANVSLEPEARVFEDPRWPAGLRGDIDTRLADGYRHARTMLKPTPYPHDWPELPKQQAHRRSAEGMGERFRPLDINVTFEDGLNHVGVEQRKCTLCGDCVTGCNHGAKNTTLMNYLPDAHNHGAEIFTQTSVRYLSHDEATGPWTVHFEALDAKRRGFDAPLLTVTADVVVLAAGTLGTTEVLLRSKERGLSLSDQLGQHFTGNGDVLGFAYNADQVVRGIGFGCREPATLEPVGPCITSAIDIREQKNLDDGLIIEEGSLPGAQAPYLPVPFALFAKTGKAPQDGIVELFKKGTREVESLLGGARTGAVDRAQTFLVMSHDGSDGTLVLEKDRVRVNWTGVGRRAAIDRDRAHLARAAEAIGATYIENPLWSTLLKHSLITVHPLGGCVMADDATSGVTNHKGQVFSTRHGTEVHAGLYVGDGAIIPRSLGVNPLLTISALAERNALLLAEERGWTIDYALPSTPRQTPATRLGLQFTEKMTGHFSTVVTDDFERATRQGKHDGSEMHFVLTIVSDDLKTMLEADDHQAGLYGTVTAPALSPDPLAVSHGVFNLFVRKRDAVDTRNMRYRMTLTATNGDTFFFSGDKEITSGSLVAVWPQTSTLYVTVHQGDTPEGPVVGRGILRITPRDFARQLTTFDVPHAESTIERARGAADFGALFAGVLWETYGGIFARAPSAPPESAIVRRKRELRVPPPEVHFFSTADHTELRLVRYRGGSHGPLLCLPGFANSTRVFAFDGVDVSFVEYFAGAGYDVWLLDYRASPDLASSTTQFTFDDVARFDWPAAVDFVRTHTETNDIQALGHCMGAATGFMTLLAGTKGIRHFVGSQVTPLLHSDRLSQLKAWAQGDKILERLIRIGTATGIDRRAETGLVSVAAGTSATEKALDALLKAYPVPSAYRSLGPVYHRIFAIYGKVLQVDQLNYDTRLAMGELFGMGNMTSFGQIREFIRRERLVSHSGEDIYLKHVDRLDLPITLIHGGENTLFSPLGTSETLAWLQQHHGAGAGRFTSHVIPGYAHLDCFLGKQAHQDVFPVIREQLDRYN